MGRAVDSVTLDTCFKEFVENVRGLRLVDVEHGTPLYRKLLREFNQSKRARLDDEQREEHQKARMIAMAGEGTRFRKLGPYAPGGPRQGPFFRPQ